MLSGTVTAEEDGSALPGATVEATHTPTGTRYNAVSRADGRWDMIGVRVGGPYTVAVQLDGFKSQQRTDIFVPLGETVEVDTALELGAIEETVNVVGEIDTIFSSTRTGNNNLRICWQNWRPRAVMCS